MMRLYKKIMAEIQEDISSEYPNLVVWVPVLFGLGIYLYDLKISLVAISILLAIACLVSCHKNIWLSLPARALLIVILGLICIKWCISSLPVYTIDREYNFVIVEGRVDNIVPQVSGNRLIISDASICMNRHKCLQYNGKHNVITNQKDNIYKLRINVRGRGIDNIKIGDLVKLKASIKPPAIPVVPEGYDFAFHAYFNQIAATGYAVSSVESLMHETESRSVFEHVSRLISQLRYDISKQVIDFLGPGRGHIASALMIGEYHSMDKQLLQIIRGSGLAHLLAVSGMHISIVTSVFFFGSRFLMALYMPLVIKYNIKKIAACIALVGSFCYLLVSGMQVSATRAFIMNFFIILAIIIDRDAYPMRSIALAALVIMIVMPYSIFTPGFQMSFAAVASLIFFYVHISSYCSEWLSRRSIFSRWIAYMVGILLASILTGIATAPFVLYHFHQCSTYGILSNLVAIPLTVFFVMPVLVLAFLAMPFSLQDWPLTIGGYGIDLVIKVAKLVYDLPYANHMYHIDSLHLGALVLGGVWLCIWQSRIRYLGGFIILIASISSVINYSKPDIIIDSKTQNFAITAPEDVLLFSSLRFSPYVRDNWLKYTLSTKVEKIGSNYKGDLVQCEVNGCILRRAGKVVAFGDVKQYCGKADIIIYKGVRNDNYACRDSEVYDRDRLSATGNVFIWLSRYGGVQVKHIRDGRQYLPSLGF